MPLLGDHIDLARKGEVRNAKLQNLAVDPANLVAGDRGLFWMDADGHLAYWDGAVVVRTGDVVIPDDSIVNAKIADGAVNDAKVSDVGVGKITGLDKAWLDAIGIDAETFDGLTSDQVELFVNKNVPNGYAGLDANGMIPDGLIPSLAISSRSVVASQAEMLALDAEEGDVAIRTDVGRTFILGPGDPTVLASWAEILTPADGVQSVQGTAGVLTSTGGVNPVLDIAVGGINAARLADGAVTWPKIDPAAGVGRFRNFVVGDGVAQAFALAHGLGNQWVNIGYVWETIAPFSGWLVDPEATDDNTVTIRFGFIPAANRYRVTVVG